MDERERLHLLSVPAVRELLAFELEAHRRILGEGSPARRRTIYSDVYSRWPQLIPALNLARGFATVAFGFTPVIIEWFRPWLSGRRVLEVGCGNGSASAILQTLASDTIGIDVSEELVAEARARVTGVTFLVADATGELPFRDRSFDTVYWNDVAEHLHPDDLAMALRELRRVLRPGGSLCTVTCHADDGPHDASMVILPRGSPPVGVHIQEFTYSGWRRLCLAAGFRDARSPLVGIGMLTRMRLLGHVDRLVGSRTLSEAVECRWVTRHSRTLRWASGCNVICCVACA